jgi:hypothetical protein
MDRVLFGDNQFFAINHMSEEKARAQAIRFPNSSAMVDVLDIAYNSGINTFMCTTHARISEICDHVRSHSDQYKNLLFYPCMPYAHKYANAVTEYGMLEAIRMFLPSDGAFSTLLKSGKSIATKDIEGIGRLLIDAEMKMFHDLKTPVIFLQNVVTDLMLGLGAPNAFRIFADHVMNEYGAEPGFITMNLPRLLDALEAVNIVDPIICANVNKVGFRMCGGKAKYEQLIANRQFRLIAMSVLASGAIPPREAVGYICEQSKIKSIVFGASSKKNIEEMKSLIDELSRVVN